MPRSLRPSLLQSVFRTAIGNGATSENEPAATTTGDRMTRLERRLNVVIALVLVDLCLPLLGVVWASVKWLLIIGPLIAVFVGLALFRHRIPAIAEAIWAALTGPTTTDVTSPSAPQDSPEATA